MQLEDLHVLLHIADYGSLRAAAQRLGLERSALRRQLARLERVFGIALVLRDGRGMSLTPAGELVTDRARGLLTEVGALVQQAQALGGQARGVVRLLLPVGLPAPVRIQALQLMRARHPDLAVHTREVPDPLRFSHLLFDLMAHFGPCPQGMDLVSHVVARPARRLLASGDYLERYGAPRSAEELRSLPILMWRCPGQPEDRLPLCAGGWLPAQPWLISSDITLVLEAAQQGLGIALLPSLLVDEQGLRTVLPEQVGDAIVFRISSQRPSRVDPRVRALLDNLKKVLESRR